jgi:hypothetical protein
MTANPTSMPERIEAALRLQPMTKFELAQCLSTTIGVIEQAMQHCRLKAVSLERNGNWRPRMRYAVDESAAAVPMMRRRPRL